MEEHHDNRADRIIDLSEAILKIQTIDEAEKFLADLCTTRELKILKERWMVCQLLETGKFSYRAIRKETGASTTTITRVAKFLNADPYNGYKRLLDKLKKEKEDVKKSVYPRVSLI